MDTVLKNALLTVEVTDPVSDNGLQVFGLSWSLPGALSYLTLDEALHAKALEVTEVSAAGSVPELKVVNSGEALVLLMAGEQLVGAKQNRVLNASLMVPAKGELKVPVSCVERGRWGYCSRKFGSEGSSSHAKLKRAMTRMATEGYRRTGRASSDQGGVWKEVDRKLMAMGSSSASAALHQVFDDRRARLDEAIAKLTLPANCSGAAFVFGGRVVGVELFDQPATLAKVLPKLIRAYALDAMEEAEMTENPPKGPGPHDQLDRTAVVNWLSQVADLESEQFASAGLGADVRFEGRNLVGASLLVAGRPVHTQFFADEE